MAYLPCQNPDCKSHGKPHPNCHCYDHITGADREAAEADGVQFPGTTNGLSLRGVRGGNARNARSRGRSVKYMAEGGEVAQYCSGKHEKGCIYFQDGGPVPPALYAGGGDMNPMAAPHAHPQVALGHAAVHHGILGLLKNIGKTNLADPDQHHQTMEVMKGHLSDRGHEKAAEHLHSRPLAGTARRSNLAHIMARLAPAMLSRESDPEALRGSIDYLNSAIKGHDSLETHIGKLIGPGKLEIEPDEDSREQLKKHLEDLKESPAKMLDIGGKLGHYMPDHAANLGATAGIATNYLGSMKPPVAPMNSMDEPGQADKGATAKWDRQLDIAQNPLKILQHAKEGSLLPQDMNTLRTLYPALHQSMVDKAGEALVNAKHKKVEIPYRQKQGLSMLLGQPLDSSMTQQSMMAIINSAGTQQAQQAIEKKNSGKPTAAQLKTINKSDTMYETPIESRMMDKKG